MSADLWPPHREPPYWPPIPETSREAADRIAPGAASLRARVWRVVFDSHPRGLTDEEIQQALNMNPSTERPRRVELVRRKMIEDSGRRRATRSGRKAIVWVVRE